MVNLLSMDIDRNGSRPDPDVQHVWGIDLDMAGQVGRLPTSLLTPLCSCMYNHFHQWQFHCKCLPRLSLSNKITGFLVQLNNLCRPGRALECLFIVCGVLLLCLVTIQIGNNCSISNTSHGFHQDDWSLKIYYCPELLMMQIWLIDIRIMVKPFLIIHNTK